MNVIHQAKAIALTTILVSELLSPLRADTADGDALINQSWDEIVEQARGSQVNWFLWGGSDAINRYVSEYIGGRLEADYDIKLNRIGINDTVEAVNIVLSEKEAGIDDKGSVDMIWINGENFRTMKQADMAFCGYTDLLPNNKLVDWQNPSIATDFGVAVDGCEVPWSKAQFALAYDTARMQQPPGSMMEILDWVRANPGRFTYPAPPDFNGSVFVRHVFYHVAGGADSLLGDFNQEKFDEVAGKTWALLNELEPLLWREGKTYPTTITALDQLFANSEVDLTFNYDPSLVGLNIESGIYPPTTQGFGLEEGTIGNTNYTLIPYNSPHKAAALVLQNLLLSGEAQYRKALPDVWGTAAAIDITRTAAAIQQKFKTIETHPNVVPAAELEARAQPELQAAWITAIEQGWRDNVGR